MLIEVLECRKGCEYCRFSVATNGMQVVLLAARDGAGPEGGWGNHQMVGEVARGLSLFGGASSEVRRCNCSVVDFYLSVLFLVHRFAAAWVRVRAAFGDG